MVAGFEFLVRRPLGTKDGALFDVRGGDEVQVRATARWPSFTLDGVECDALQRGVVRPCQANDRKLKNGQQGFCIEITSRGGKNVNLYATSDAERQEWCALLRKYAVHLNIENGFQVTSKVLGTGAYAVVKLAKDHVTKQEVALKIIKKSRLDNEERGLLVDEVRIAQETRHKFCVKTLEFVETREEYVIVMEAALGGELFERIVYHRYQPEEVRALFRQLLAALAFLHSRSICHRDVKPENILLTTERPMTMKLADYGVATSATQGNLACLKDGAQLRCSPGYGAPEIVREQPYGMPCDIWSAGVTLYLLLSGKQPFTGSTPDQTRQLMIKGDYDASLLQSDPLAADLVARMLEKDPARRITATQALEHPWVFKSAAGQQQPTATRMQGGKEPSGCFACFFGGSSGGGPAFRDPSYHSMRVPQVIPDTSYPSYQANPTSQNPQWTVEGCHPGTQKQ